MPSGAPCGTGAAATSSRVRPLLSFPQLPSSCCHYLLPQEPRHLISRLWLCCTWLPVPSSHPTWYGLCRSRGVSPENIPCSPGVGWSQNHHQRLQAYANEPLQGPRGLMWTPSPAGPRGTCHWALAHSGYHCLVTPEPRPLLQPLLFSSLLPSRGFLKKGWGCMMAPQCQLRSPF